MPNLTANHNKIIITGITGTIARYLTPILLTSGLELVGIARRTPQESLAIPVHVGDMSDEVFITSVMRGAHTVIHAAALTRSAIPVKLKESNEDMTTLLAKVAYKEGVKRFIYLSSDLAINPAGPYGTSKLACENIIKNAGLIDWVCLRLSPFIGSCNSLDNSTFAKFIAKIQLGKRIWLPAGGRFPVAPLSAADLACLIVKILGTYSELKKTYTVTGEIYPLADFISAVAEKEQLPVKTGNVPMGCIHIAQKLLMALPFIRHPLLESLTVLDRVPEPSIAELQEDFGFQASKLVPMLNTIENMR